MKKVLSLILAAMLAASMLTISSSATNEATLSVSSASGAVGDTVSITIEIENNPGIVALRLHIGYNDNRLELVGVANGVIFNADTSDFGNIYSANPYTLLWLDPLSSVNNTQNGVLATLTFRILHSAAAAVPVTLTYDQGSTFNANMEDVSFSVSNGYVNVEGSETPLFDVATVALADAVVLWGDTFEIPVSVHENPGIVAMHLKISYDRDKLMLLGVEDRELFPGCTCTFGNDLNAVPYNMVWDSDSAVNHTDSGVLAVLRFMVKSTAALGETKIDIETDSESTFDCALDNVDFDTVSGKITVDGLEITGAASAISVGNTVQLSAKRVSSTDDESASDVSWTSGNPLVASVDSNGEVKAEGGGNAEITATDSCGRTGKCIIRVVLKDNDDDVSIVNLSGSCEQKVNWWKPYSSATMSLSYRQSGCGDATRFEWSSSSSRVKVDRDGNITNTGFFRRSATITLTAKDNDGSVIASDSITVCFYKFSRNSGFLQCLREAYYCCWQCI